MARSANSGVDNGHPRYSPDDKLSVVDRLVPQRHGRWWNWDARRGQSKSEAQLFDELKDGHKQGDGRAVFEHVQAVAATAVERAAAADRRATTIAGTVSISVSLTTAAAGFLLDAVAGADDGARHGLALAILFAVLMFVLSAGYALWSLVGIRVWNRTNPHDLDSMKDIDVEEWPIKRAAQTLFDFGYNWEISDQKNRYVDLALRFLGAALVGVALFALMLVRYSWTAS